MLKSFFVIPKPSDGETHETHDEALAQARRSAADSGGEFVTVQVLSSVVLQVDQVNPVPEVPVEDLPC